MAGTSVFTLTASGALTLLAGTVAGSDLVDIDMGQDADLNSVARIATGSALYMVKDGVVTLEDFPESGGAGASSVCYHRGFWIAQEAGTDQFYYQLPGATSWDALSFASAEYAPDPGVAVRSRGDQIALLNAKTSEIWTLTGDTDVIAPFGGLNFDYGCRARPTAVNCQGALIWVDDECAVRQFEGGEPKIISDNGLAEQIRKTNAADLRASFYMQDEHPLYVLTLGSTATWVYDLSTQIWTRFSSQGYDFWRAHLFVTIGDTVLACDALDDQLYRLDPDRRTDGDDTFTVEFMGFVEAPANDLACANLQLLCEVGNSPLSGQGSAPLIRLRMSDNQGKTFGRWFDRSLGATGQYSTKVRWNALGTIRAPQGRIFHWQVSDPVGRRFSQAMMNV